MITECAYPKSTGELVKIVRKHTDGFDSVAVQAGHFLVYYYNTEGIMLPCVRQELKSPAHSVKADSIGVFPFMTWRTGLELLKNMDCPKKAILTVVNDWQWLPKHVDRAGFYQKYPYLFDSYLKELNKYNDVVLLTQNDLGYKVKTGVWFSEVSLRNQYKRQISKMVKRGALPENAELFENGHTESCSLDTAVDKRQEIYCTGKRPSCTQEIAELVRQICIVGKYEMFINIYPLVCKQYVQGGTELCISLMNSADINVINIGIPTYVGAEHEQSPMLMDVSLHKNI